MASCRPPPPRAAAMPAAAAATAASRAAATPVSVLLQHRVLLQYTLLQHPLSSKYNVSTSSDILAAASHATAAAVLILGSTSIHTKPRCNFRSEDVPYLGLLHEVAPAVPSAGRTRARTSCCLRRRDGKECRLYTHNGTKALIRHLHKASYMMYMIHPRRFARNASYECSCLWRITDRGTPQKVAVVAVVHYISWATARAGPSKHVSGLMGTVDVVVVVAVVNHISWAAVRAGPSKHMSLIMGREERPI